MKPAVDNAADKDQVQKAERKLAKRRRSELGDLRDVLRTEAGRRVIWRILEHCGVFRSIYDPGSLIYFNEGKRDVGLFLMAELAQADRHAFLRMMSEADRDDAKEEIEEQKQPREEDKDA